VISYEFKVYNMNDREMLTANGQHGMAKYEVLSRVFRYPDSAFVNEVSDVQGYFEEYDPSIGKILKPFSDFVANAKISQLEELFTRSFEVQAITTLDVGYILFGDDYKRAELLVNMNREHAEAGVDCGVELPDHLVNILKLLPKIADKAIVPDLISKILQPALRKMIAEFEPSHIERKNKVYRKHHKTMIEQSEVYGLIYQFPLKTLDALLIQDFGNIEKEEFIKSDFLKSINTEMTIEKE
jgi:nitrate reductase assembly molybdenum cofactor insertion protein NarJ